MQLRGTHDLASTTASRGVRRLGVAVAGFGVLTLGVALLVVPIPGTTVVVFPVGLAILAREFLWARRLLGWSTALVHRTWAGVRRLFGARKASPTPVPSG
jgi:hypothetical protein